MQKKQLLALIPLLLILLTINRINFDKPIVKTESADLKKPIVQEEIVPVEVEEKQIHSNEIKNYIVNQELKIIKIPSTNIELKQSNPMKINPVPAIIIAEAFILQNILQPKLFYK
jgi:hypothetical protein